MSESFRLTMGTATLFAGSPGMFLSPAHGLVTGDIVLLVGFESTPRIEGDYEVFVTDPDHFHIGASVIDVGEAEGIWQKNPESDAQLMGILPPGE
jgi:hypothetical protein